MAHPIVTQLTLVAGSANTIATVQSLVAPALTATLNGASVAAGIAVLTPARRVIVTSSADDSGITFTITGTARAEMGSVTFSETITGANAGAAATTQDFATVTRVVASGSTAGTITVGTNDTASGPWVPWDSYRTPFSVSLMTNIMSGTPTFQVDVTYDDVFGTWLPTNVPFPRALGLTGMTALVANTAGSISVPVRASRLTLVAAGSVQLTQLQAKG